MKKLKMAALMGAGIALMPAMAQAFGSGSTGADGAFSPTANTKVVLPPNGILNYTTVNIPAGVTVSFKRNTTNTPVVILASGNVTIAGTVLVSGGDAAATGAAGDGVLADDGTPGAGAPGGYDGGRGGEGTFAGGAGNGPGGVGLGPGGGKGGLGNTTYCNCSTGGGGGGFDAGATGNYPYRNNGFSNYGGVPGSAYGSKHLQPLIGGSGGGGGAGREFRGAGGGGGGGAILIASSGTVSITGSILANGGVGGATDGSGHGGAGGGGSGGAIRIVATAISGNGTLQAIGGTAGLAANSHYSTSSAGAGAKGRIRLEAEIFTRTATSNPVHSQDLPGPVFLATPPTLRIDSIGGYAVPAEPTGNADVTLPTGTANPVTVVFTTTGVPAGNAVKLSVKPETGAEVTAVSSTLVGDTTGATASVDITFPNGPSTLMATVTYNVVLAMGEALSMYAQGERVEKITLASALGSKESTVTLITVSGKEFVVPAGVLVAMPAA